jgi:hypothetical protein
METSRIGAARMAEAAIDAIMIAIQRLRVGERHEDQRQNQNTTQENPRRQGGHPHKVQNSRKN